MATSQLTLYQGALRLLGQTDLEDLDEAREPRYILDDIWDENTRNFVLEQGLWNFAMRSAMIEDDTSITPDFGFRYAFAKPSDWVRTGIVCSDEYFRTPLTQMDFRDENGYWWSDIDPLYVQYVSNDSSYGNSLSLWPQTFVKYVEAYLAEQAAPRLFQTEEKIGVIRKLTLRRLLDARAKDGLNEGAGIFPSGSWAAARRGGWGRRDRGSRSRLTG